MNQYFYAGDLDAVGAGDPTETLAFLAAIQENETVNAGNAPLLAPLRLVLHRPQ